MESRPVLSNPGKTLPSVALDTFQPRLDPYERHDALQNPDVYMSYVLPVICRQYESESSWASCSTDSGEGLRQSVELGAGVLLDRVLSPAGVATYYLTIHDENRDYLLRYGKNTDLPEITMRYWQNGTWRRREVDNWPERLSVSASAVGLLNRSLENSPHI